MVTARLTSRALFKAFLIIGAKLWTLKLGEVRKEQSWELSNWKAAKS